jgi:DNA-binding FadR family transcriptional regulator
VAARASLPDRPARTLLEQVQELIIETGLSGGDRLPTEHQLADELGASRSAVRESLHALRALDIVEIRPGHGIYLRDAAPGGLAGILTFWGRLFERGGQRSLELIAEVREALETDLLVKVAPLLTAEAIDELSGIVDEMEDRARQGKTAFAADRRFHEVLYRPLDNWILDFLLDAFWDAFLQARSSEKPQRPPSVVAVQHRELVEALRVDDIAGAVSAMRAHFDNALHRRPARRAH